MDAREYEYTKKLKLITHWLRAFGLEFTVATDRSGHYSVRFWHKGVEHQINGIIGPKLEVITLPEELYDKYNESGLPDMKIERKSHFIDGPFRLGVWTVPDNVKLFDDEDPMVIVESIQQYVQ